MTDAELRDELMTLLVGRPRDDRHLAGLGGRAPRAPPRRPGAPGGRPGLRRRGGQGDPAPAAGRRRSSCASCSSRSRSAATSCRRARRWRRASCSSTAARTSTPSPRPSAPSASSTAAPGTYSWIPFGGGVRALPGRRLRPGRDADRAADAGRVGAPGGRRAHRGRPPARHHARPGARRQVRALAPLDGRSTTAGERSGAIHRLTCPPPVPDLFLQRDQPPGVPPLALDGERTLPDIPEENYWFRRHLVVYEWIARAHRRRERRRPRVRRGLRLRRAGRQRLQRRRRGRQPRRARARAAALPRAQPALRAQHGRDVLRAVRRRRLPADDRARPRPRRRARERQGRCCRPAGRRTCRRPTSSRWRPRAPSARATRGTCASTAREEFRALCAAHFGSVELYGLFHARRLRVHELALRAGWDRVHAALRVTEPFYDRFVPAISTRDFALRAERDLDRALDFVAVLEAMTDGRLAIVLHSHLPTSRASGRGRSARSGCGRRSRPPTCRCSTCCARARRSRCR